MLHDNANHLARDSLVDVDVASKHNVEGQTQQAVQAFCMVATLAVLPIHVHAVH